uniref:26S protease regulatory subunit 6 n=1 Tax=Rhizophora mucronata TaxID=61149 RepID=A0A2P2IH54_RHIMU
MGNVRWEADTGIRFKIATLLGWNSNPCHYILILLTSNLISTNLNETSQSRLQGPTERITSAMIQIKFIIHKARCQPIQMIQDTSHPTKRKRDFSCNFDFLHAHGAFFVHFLDTRQASSPKKLLVSVQK